MIALARTIRFKPFRSIQIQNCGHSCIPTMIERVQEFHTDGTFVDRMHHETTRKEDNPLQASIVCSPRENTHLSKPADNNMGRSKRNTTPRRKAQKRTVEEDNSSEGPLPEEEEEPVKMVTEAEALGLNQSKDDEQGQEESDPKQGETGQAKEATVERTYVPERSRTKHDLDNYDDFMYIPVRMAVKAETVIKTMLRAGSGIGMVKGAITSERVPVITNNNGDIVHMNEPRNEYGLKILSRIIHAYNNDQEPEGLREDGYGNKIRNSPDEVIEQVILYESQHAAHLHGDSIVGVPKRILTKVANIVKGFCKTDHEYNHELMKIVCTYCDLRLGHVVYKGDEWAAMRRAITDYYFNHGDGTNIERSNMGWIWPIFYMVKGHMESKKVTPPLFDVHKEVDEQLTEQRKENSAEIVRGGQLCTMERREHVRKELERYLEDHMTTLVSLTKNTFAKDDGTPSPNKRRKSNGKYLGREDF